jgi:CMP-N,N'-diacetyllegionaminic acid synthase
MKIIGLITARAGSKGLPGKNKKIFANKPLVEWTIEAALKARMLDRIVVSTNDWDIVAIAKRCGVDVPFVRPDDLSQDKTPHIDVVMHALREVGIDNYTHCCLLQPTSPLRTSDDIDEACILQARNSRHSVISVTEDYHYPFIVSANMLGGINNPPKGYLARQKIQPRYYINGALFINPVKTLKSSMSFYSGKLIPYVMPKERSLQIDDMFDFDITEYVMICSLESQL